MASAPNQVQTQSAPIEPPSDSDAQQRMHASSENNSDQPHRQRRRRPRHRKRTRTRRHTHNPDPDPNPNPTKQNSTETRPDDQPAQQNMTFPITNPTITAATATETATPSQIQAPAPPEPTNTGSFHPHKGGPKRRWKQYSELSWEEKAAREARETQLAIQAANDADASRSDSQLIVDRRGRVKRPRNGAAWQAIVPAPPRNTNLRLLMEHETSSCERDLDNTRDHDKERDLDPDSASWQSEAALESDMPDLTGWPLNASEASITTITGEALQVMHALSSPSNTLKSDDANLAKEIPPLQLDPSSHSQQHDWVSYQRARDDEVAQLRKETAELRDQVARLEALLQTQIHAQMSSEAQPKS